jgi:hypothetical protein
METLHITYIDATWQLNSPGAAILLTKSYATLLIDVKLTTNPPTPSTYVGLFQHLPHPKSCPSYFPDSIQKQEILDNNMRNNYMPPTWANYRDWLVKANHISLPALYPMHISGPRLQTQFYTI